MTQGGKFFRTLPSGVRVDHGDVQPRNSRPSASSAGKAKAARIDEDDEAGSSEFTWSLEPIEFGSSSDPDIPWNVRGSDEAKVDQVVAMIEAAIAKSREDTHEGILTVPQSLIPRSKPAFVLSNDCSIVCHSCRTSRFWLGQVESYWGIGGC